MTNMSTALCLLFGGMDIKVNLPRTKCRGMLSAECVTLLLVIFMSSFLRPIRSDDTSSEEHPGDYCRWQSFNASCPGNSVVMMTKAQYGRMKVGTCMERDYFIGCYSDVIKQVDGRCSGRHQCTIAVPDPELHDIQPCPDDLGTYLSANYKCVDVISDFRHTCHASEPIEVEASSGYLASIVTLESTYGSSRCPWRLRVAPGQTINITLFDFGVDKNFKKQDNTYCPVYAKIKEPGDTREATVCGDTERVKRVYTSVGNDVEISIEVASSRDANQHFLFKYEAIGCATPAAPVRGWVQRKGNTVVIGCNVTSKKWHLVCQDTHWVGQYENCTKPGMLGQVFPTEGGFPFGLVVSIVIGIVLGVVIGVSLLAIVLACRKRRQKRARDAALVFQRPYGSGVIDSGYGGSALQKWGPGAHGAQYSSYAHIWELKQNPQQTQHFPRGGGGDSRLPAMAARDNNGPNSALARCQNRSPKEHIYESPKFERKDSIDSYADPPFYHEFDLDNPPLDGQGVQGGGGNGANQNSANKAFRYNIDDSRYSS